MESFFNTFGNIEAIKYVMNSIEDMVFIMKVENDHFKYEYINEATSKVLNYRNHEIRGKIIEEVVPHHISRQLITQYNKVAQTLRPQKFELNYSTKSLELIGEVSLNPILSDDGKCIFIIGIVRDLTERAKQYQELHELKLTLQSKQEQLAFSKQQYEALFLNHPDAMFLMDLEGGFISCNPAAERLAGYSQAELIGNSFTDFLSDTEVDNTVDKFNACIADRKAISYEVDYLDKNQNKLTLLITNIPLLVHDRMEGVFGTARDITEIKRQQEQLAQMAYFDYLTGLSNRRVFDEELAWALDKAVLTNESVALMILDGKEFKKINDSFGHDTGDAVIKEMAKRIQVAVRKTDIVARLGGDEIGVILPDIETKELVENIAERIIKSMHEPLHFNNARILFGMTIGIAIFPTHARQRNDLIKFADEALYHAKRNGFDYSFYNKS
ncbi:sensor domain-containing protein [Ornithinibacillus xuwenensis]|uniref:Diguanylate cyclase n=1 Tax=Ornithinibacillus xuwenensis TaxID=3144668 RepID=A0ABU9XIS0_9BACI